MLPSVRLLNPSSPRRPVISPQMALHVTQRPATKQEKTDKADTILAETVVDYAKLHQIKLNKNYGEARIWADISHLSQKKLRAENLLNDDDEGRQFTDKQCKAQEPEMEEVEPPRSRAARADIARRQQEQPLALGADKGQQQQHPLAPGADKGQQQQHRLAPGADKGQQQQHPRALGADKGQQRPNLEGEAAAAAIAAAQGPSLVEQFEMRYRQQLLQNQRSGAAQQQQWVGPHLQPWLANHQQMWLQPSQLQGPGTPMGSSQGNHGYFVPNSQP
ncbi:hypothetical protein V8C86DRAFT_950363 [Haematococcus lacustris]